MSTFASALIEPGGADLSVQEIAAAIQALTDADKTAVEEPVRARGPAAGSNLPRIGRPPGMAAGALR
jgi:hypothetical protein